MEKKNRRPSGRIDNPSAKDGSQGAGQSTGCGPGADGAAPRLAGECAAEYGEAVGHQQRGPQSLQAASGQEPGKGRCRSTSQRGQSKNREPNLKQAAPTEMIAQRAADQDQYAQRQQVSIDRPGQIGRVDLEIVCQRG